MTGTEKTVRFVAAMYAVLLSILLMAMFAVWYWWSPHAGTKGFSTSNGQGKVVGLNEYLLDSQEDELKKDDWTLSILPKSKLHLYKGNLQLTVDRNPQMTKAHLIYRNGRLVEIFVKFEGALLEEHIVRRLRREYGFGFDTVKDPQVGYSHTDKDAYAVMYLREDVHGDLFLMISKVVQ